jgi:hypothetical protein
MVPLQLPTLIILFSEMLKFSRFFFLKDKKKLWRKIWKSSAIFYLLKLKFQFLINYFTNVSPSCQGITVITFEISISTNKTFLKVQYFSSKKNIFYFLFFNYFCVKNSTFLKII